MKNMVLLFYQTILGISATKQTYIPNITSATQRTTFEMLDCRLEAPNLANFGAKNEWAFLPKFFA